MAEQSIPVRIIRKVLADEFAMNRRVATRTGDEYGLMESYNKSLKYFIHHLEDATGTPIRRRPRHVK